jgi:lysophospholipase L1-like esterase
MPGLKGWRATALAFALGAFAVSAAPALAAKPLAPVQIILVGDSTMAKKSGYGDGFCAQFRVEVTCVNGGRGGRSTKNYRVDGIWKNDIVPKLSDKTFSRTYVLIQFGHNDGSPNPERHADVLWEYPANLVAYAKEVQAAGAIPILVTPLTMRNFVDHKLLPDRVAPFAAIMQSTATKNHLRIIDLFGESQKAVQKMGIVRANHTLAGGPIPRNVLETEAAGTTVPTVFDDASQRSTNERQGFDDTHLGPQGGLYFGKMVADLLVREAPELKVYRKGR